MNIKNKQHKYEKALEYEIFIKEEYGFAKKEIQNAECIFDVWGHIWLFSKWCRSLNPEARIYYFEPVWEFYEKARLLLKNDRNIIMNNLWISDKTEDWTVLLNTEKTMQSSKYSSFLNPKWIEIGVNFISLKDYLEQENINKIDVLKMDIEWMEFEVQNSRWDFEWEKINNLIAEIHLIDEDKKSQRNYVLEKIKNKFSKVKIFDSWYNNDVFLVRAYKISE